MATMPQALIDGHGIKLPGLGTLLPQRTGWTQSGHREKP